MQLMRFLAILSFVVAALLPWVVHAEGEELLLRDNLQRACTGDYLVVNQNKNTTLLLVRSKDTEYLQIEEITLPSNRAPRGTASWKAWIESGAPGHTCRLLYNIHLPSGTMQHIFSYTRNEWMLVPQAQNFFSMLLNLKLKKIPDRERKRIGPPPSTDKVDRRKMWQPNLVADGQIVKGVSFDAWRTRWPKDGSELSGKIIEVYMPKDNEQYPSYFPYWLQISGLVGQAKVRIADSGRGLSL